MSSFTQSVVKIARNIRASEQDVLLARNRIAIDDYVDSELAMRLMYEDEKKHSNGYAYTRFRNQLIDFDNQLQGNTEKINSYLQKFGIKSLNATHEIHHMSEAKTHFFETGKDAEYYNNLINRLKKHDKELLDELKNIVIIPGWLHRYCHLKNIDHETRNDYYKILKKILMSLSTKKQDHNSEDDSEIEIKSIKFNGNSINTAIKSIRNLASIQGDSKNPEIIESLRKCYNLIRDEMLDVVRKINFD